MKTQQRTNVLRGFSLIELIIVLAMILIVTAIAIPAVRQTAAGYQLDASGHAVASLLQNARQTAVKTNQPYYAQYNGAGSTLAFAVPAIRSDNPPDGANYSSVTDPTVTTVGNVAFQQVGQAGSGPPNHAQLDSYLGGAAVQIETSGVIGFNARGLPCMASNGSQWICAQTDPVAGGTPAFEWFMRDSRTKGWEAVTVSPAGRIKTWRLTSSTGSWQ
jgi:prepilin-type N-terminal cleavage/methylation domain-containing protein